ncbi:probable G-protein coupled receptor Mth-like 1 [Linepithema humile]|uniref:probable G-protein coupled receptor Mth-like 1 n=1 Tax=Linepithema humile TaxID=83485 RepID=UPI0006237539|nr:PREDICTED: probable G-protein coupled receptor Mth-like 1 [Linepithema humile]XP_012233863.1 PREDICTED: probable G-protein coupled receptor Mth-like 1 [Linepithema humile]
MRAFLRCFAFVTATAVLVVSEPNNLTNSQVTILKCCRYGEALQQSDDNSDEIPHCQPTKTVWKPLIYSRKSQGFVFILAEWRILDGRRPECDDQSELIFLPSRVSAPVFLMEEDGAAMPDPNNPDKISANHYCTDSNGLLTCEKKSMGNHAAATMRPRVRRCCGENATFNQQRNACEHLTKEIVDAPPLLPNASSVVEIITGFPTCPKSDNFTILGDTKDAVLQPDGGLEINGIALPTSQFCVERIKELNQIAKVFACPEHAPQRPAVQATDIRFTLYPLGFIISAIFLAATLAAGCLLPASHHVLHWRCQTHHVACLMMGDILMAIIQLAGDSLHGVSCKALAIMAHFFFLAAFFWLNTMCFNIWWTFRDLRPVSLEKGQETLRLRVYACYAWGGPLLVAGLAALLDHLPPQPQYTFLRPRFGEKQCWFYGDMEILAYFFGPVGVLLAINLLFFAVTARELTCGLWKGEFVKSTTERATLGRICMKLVIVMGITWVADVLSWAVGGPQYIWYVTDLINAFQGVLIFVAVGFQPQVRAAVKRFFSRNPQINAGRQGNGHSTTSHGMPSMGDSVTQNPSTKTAPLETIC